MKCGTNDSLNCFPWFRSRKSLIETTRKKSFSNPLTHTDSLNSISDLSSDLNVKYSKEKVRESVFRPLQVIQKDHHDDKKSSIPISIQLKMLTDDTLDYFVDNENDEFDTVSLASSKNTIN